MSAIISADGVERSTAVIQAAGGGSIPASALHFRAGACDEAAALVLRFHYSRRLPSNVQYVARLHTSGGLFGDYGECVAAAFFSIPPTRWSEAVIELSRLVRADGLRIPLTLLVSLACSRLKREGHDLIVSFADAMQDHEGYVYQACGWNYHGKRERRMDGLIVDGRFVPGRSCNSAWGTSSPSRLREKITGDVEPHYDEGKHLYWKALGRRGEAKAARLELGRNPYPKKGDAGAGRGEPNQT